MNKSSQGTRAGAWGTRAGETERQWSPHGLCLGPHGLRPCRLQSHPNRAPRAVRPLPPLSSSSSSPGQAGRGRPDAGDGRGSEHLSPQSNPLTIGPQPIRASSKEQPRTPQSESISPCPAVGLFNSNSVF